MKTEIIHPLNSLKDQDPESYEKAVAKYKDREHVLSVTVNASGKLWNDHVFLSPVNPAEIVKKQVEQGVSQEELVSLFKDIQIIKIPGERLTGKTVLLYDYLETNKPNDADTMNAETRSIDLKDYDCSQPIREKTLNHWKEQAMQGKRPLFFSGIPHILVEGDINIQGCELHPIFEKQSISNKI